MPAIYVLKSTRDNVIRYVGKAVNPAHRFQQHYTYGYRRCSFVVYDWLQRERWLGFDLDFGILEYCEGEILDARERY